MIQYAIFTVLLALGLIDVFYLNAHLFILPFGFVLLHMHAEASAHHFLFYKKPTEKDPAPEPEDYFAQVKIPLSMQRAKNTPEPDEPQRPILQIAGPSEVRKEKKKKAEPKPAQAKNEFRPPRFHGAPHEVLGIDDKANTHLIQKAFRYWMKKYHPDHQQSSVKQKATEQARRLQEAKAELIEKRHRAKQGKMAA